MTWLLGGEELGPGDATDNWEAAELEVETICLGEQSFKHADVLSEKN